MDYETARRRLANHANMADDLPIEDSLIGSLWLADKGKQALSVADHAADVLVCLDVVNITANGFDPAMRSGPSAGQQILLDVSYSVSCIITSGIGYHRSWLQNQRFFADELGDLELAIHRIAYAWAQVQASDVTDLHEGFDLLD